MAREEPRSAPDERIDEYLRSYVESDPEKRSLFDPMKRGRLPLILTGLGAFAVGVFLWGSLFMAIVSGVGSIAESDADETAANGAGGANGTTASEPAPLDCATLAERETLSGEEQLFFDAECVEEEEEEEPAPTEEAPPDGPADPSVNRENCDQIRGTAYHSPEERVWFLDNCVTN